MRQGIRRLAQRLLWASGVSFVASRLLPEDARFAIELHGVAEREFVELPEELRPSMTADSLRALLAWLDRRFRFLSPEEFLESNRPGVMMTFDDGFANHVEVALPILEEFSAPAVFFVPSRHVDHPDDWLPSERARLSRRSNGNNEQVGIDVVQEGLDEEKAGNSPLRKLTQLKEIPQTKKPK